MHAESGGTTTSYIHDSSFLNIFNISNTSNTSNTFLPRLLDACSIIMPVHHQPHPRCTSAGRVTARTLLSFLALSTPIVAFSARQQQDLIPILPPLLSEPETQQPSGRDHVFVSSVTFHTTLMFANYPITRHYDMYSTMETSTDLQLTRGSTSRSPHHRYG